MPRHARLPAAVIGVALLCANADVSAHESTLAMNTPVVAPAATAPRWYTSLQVERGAEVYARNCAACHGAQAQGATLGTLEAPALDGSGHSAHHGLDYLLQQVAEGGMRRGGRMPGFGEVLSPDERRAAIAWIQSRWPETVYRQWHVSQGGHSH